MKKNKLLLNIAKEYLLKNNVNEKKKKKHTKNKNELNSNVENHNVFSDQYDDINNVLLNMQNGNINDITNKKYNEL